MKKYLKHLKNNLSDQEIAILESSIKEHINDLQKATLIDLKMPLKDFVIARR